MGVRTPLPSSGYASVTIGYMACRWRAEGASVRVQGWSDRPDCVRRNLYRNHHHTHQILHGQTSQCQSVIHLNNNASFLLLSPPSVASFVGSSPSVVWAIHPAGRQTTGRQTKTGQHRSKTISRSNTDSYPNAKFCRKVRRLSPS